MSLRVAQAAMLFMVLAAPTLVMAQILPPQTEAEKRLRERCFERSDAHVSDPFAYPLRVGASPDGKTLGVFVIPEKWNKLSARDRLTMMRDVACWYAGGRLNRRFWYDFSAVDPETKKNIETFSADQLWPRSGHYH